MNRTFWIDTDTASDDAVGLLGWHPVLPHRRFHDDDAAGSIHHHWLWHRPGRIRPVGVGLYVFSWGVGLSGGDLHRSI